jgi:uncharacterized protein (TIGR00661 family)
MSEKKNILIAPLNWGLGHATRCVPVIYNHIKKGNNVIVAADGQPLAFLKKEFPNLKFITLTGYKIKYSPSNFLFLYLLLQMPFFLMSIVIEHFKLKKIVKTFNIDIVVSDNRYGLFNKKTENLLITHQIFIRLPRFFKPLQPLVHFFTKLLINNFDRCLVPDFKDNKKNLSGKLSHGKRLPENVEYINPLSRFSLISDKNIYFKDIEIPDVLVLVSGPEPHRTIFEKKYEQKFARTNLKVLIICGTPERNIIKSKYKNIIKIPHLETEKLYFLLKNTKKIIARSGYSTIMDFYVLNIKAELHPTPGQTEQEYLASLKYNF